MKKELSLLVVLLLLVSHPVFSRPGDLEDALFTPPRVYFYGLGSANWYVPPSWDYDLHDGQTVGVGSMVIGAGYSLINFWDQGFVNLEMDHTTALYNTAAIRDRRVSTLSFNCVTDWKVSRRHRVSLHGGMGVGFHFISEYDYLDPEDIQWVVYSDVAVTVSLLGGVKISLAEHLFFRTDIRLYLESSEVYPDDAETRMVSLLFGIEYIL